MGEYRPKQPGDVLFLRNELDNAEIGFYVLVNPYGDLVSLVRLGEDSETGKLVPTPTTVSVSIADLSLFHPTGLRVEISVEQSLGDHQEIGIGDILEPLQGASVPTGLYEVIQIEGDDLLLSRLHSNEDDKLATTGRVSWIGRAELGMFRRLRITADLRA